MHLALQLEQVEGGADGGGAAASDGDADVHRRREVLAKIERRRDFPAGQCGDHVRRRQSGRKLVRGRPRREQHDAPEARRVEGDLREPPLRVGDAGHQSTNGVQHLALVAEIRADAGGRLLGDDRERRLRGSFRVPLQQDDGR